MAAAPATPGPATPGPATPGKNQLPAPRWGLTRAPQIGPTGQGWAHGTSCRCNGFCANEPSANGTTPMGRRWGPVPAGTQWLWKTVGGQQSFGMPKGNCRESHMECGATALVMQELHALSALAA